MDRIIGAKIFYSDQSDKREITALFPEAIKFESRRRLQKFLILPKLSLPLLWFILRQVYLEKPM
jgi:hypothetical protein